ncbi:hypothetical protein D3C86_1265520 [compost metagenome]
MVSYDLSHSVFVSVVYKVPQHRSCDQDNHSDLYFSPEPHATQNALFGLEFFTSCGTSIYFRDFCCCGLGHREGQVVHGYFPYLRLELRLGTAFELVGWWNVLSNELFPVTIVRGTQRPEQVLTDDGRVGHHEGERGR